MRTTLGGLKMQFDTFSATGMTDKLQRGWSLAEFRAEVGNVSAAKVVQI
jgi:hypothetical protein